MEDVAQNPQSPLVKWKQLSRIHVGVYRLDHSREHVPDPAGRVRAPRHALILRVAHDGVVEFIGIIHDHMLRGRALRKIIRANPDDA